MIKNFTYQELLPLELLEFGNIGVTRYLDAKLLACLDYIRTNLGKPIIVNTPECDGRTIRLPRHPSYRVSSDHNVGKAIDFDVIGMDADSVRRWMVKDTFAGSALFKLGLTGVEDGVEWVHMTVADLTGWNIPVVNRIYIIPKK